MSDMNQKVSASYYVRPAKAGDNESILALLSETSQPGKLRLAFERYPNFFHGAGVSCDKPDVYILEKTQFTESENPMVGIFNLGRRRLYINGKPRLIPYAHDLHIAGDARGGQALHAAYSRAREITLDQDWLQTVVATDNTFFLDSIKRRRTGMPDFYRTGDIETSLIMGRNRNALHDGLQLRTANSSDLAAMQSFYDREASRRQFAPVYRFQELQEGSPFYRGLELTDYLLAWDGDELVGIAGTWDQQSFRQTRVDDYDRSVGLARPFYNAWNKFGAGVHLPAKGQCFNYRMVHTLLSKGQDDAVLDAMLCHLHRCYRPYYDALICGFFDEDPGASVAARFSRKLLRSHHFLMTWGDLDPRDQLDTSLTPYVEVARL